jgi:hypothetical protein
VEKGGGWGGEVDLYIQFHWGRLRAELLTPWRPFLAFR